MSTKSLKSCQVTDYWDQTKVVIQHLQGNTAEGKLWKWVHTIHFNWANVQMYLIVQNIMMIVRHKANYTISRKLWSKCFYLLFYDKSRVGNIHSLDTFTFDFYDLLFIYCDMVGPILIQQKHKLCLFLLHFDNCQARGPHHVQVNFRWLQGKLKL